jgi:hypothetical protein
MITRRGWSDAEQEALLTNEGRRMLILTKTRSRLSVTSMSHSLGIKLRELGCEATAGKKISYPKYEEYSNKVNLHEMTKISGYHRAQYVMAQIIENYVPTTFDFFITNLGSLNITKYVFLLDCLNYKSAFKYVLDYKNRRKVFEELWGHKYGGVELVTELPEEAVETEKIPDDVEIPTKEDEGTFTVDLFGLRIEIVGQKTGNYLKVSEMKLSLGTTKG